VHGVITGGAESLPRMAEGEKNQLWIPEALSDRSQIPPYGLLVFDVELSRIG
jgi:FKBP-type peptidyl-prolyl cis-trans isomerase